MKRISDPIIEDESIIVNTCFSTVRGIIINDNKILMVYSKLFDDYMFPGGHLKEGEDKLDGLKRELKEELGASIVIKEPFGYIEEIRYDAKNTEKTYKQTSYYYFCDIVDLGPQSLDYLESLYGVTPLWISIDEVILHNEKISIDDIHTKKGFKTVMIRELTILKALKKRGLK